MNRTKKIIAVVLSVLMMLSCASLFAFAAEEETTLKFGDDGKFTILNFADIQDGYPLMTITKKLLQDTIKMVQPDLIVLTGDNISGGSTTTKVITRAAINEYMSIFEKAGIPTAAVFGNHDDESALADKDFQMSVYESYDCFVGYNEGDIIPGVGTYNLPIMSSDGEKIAFNIWMTDSGTYNSENDLGGYACTTKEQIAWYVEKSNELKAQNGGEIVPSINFQHIIVPDIYDALVECEEGTPNSIEKDGKCLTLPEGSTGVLHEAPCPPNYSNGQFQAFLQQGDVIATVCGHDHVNDFVVPYKGIDIINTPGVGFSSYNDDTVGSRVIVLDENDTSTYETYVLGYFDVYGDDEVAFYRYQAYSRTTDDLTKFVSWFKMIFAYIKALFA
ncbi:MAG: metallophosphoesterase [Clostridia bacterium]|nr:metallophosphoesterase [Clostridia bacterium]